MNVDCDCVTLDWDCVIVIVDCVIGLCLCIVRVLRSSQQQLESQASEVDCVIVYFFIVYKFCGFCDCVDKRPR